MELKEIAKTIKEAKENIFLIYAFNGTGKTRLSKEYKDLTKDADGNHTGVYYNAYSEDLFRWNNDEPNKNENIRLEVVNSSLSTLYQYFGNEGPIKDKLKIYQPNYDFRFKYVNDNQEKGIEYIWFFKEDDRDTWIKISRGEERIFIWCFFLALFEIEDFEDAHKDYIFIDDPVSSLDDNNLYLTAMTLFELLEKTIDSDKKIIISTHHIGLFSLLIDWLGKGEHAIKFKKKEIVQHKKESKDEIEVYEVIEEENRYCIKILERNGGDYLLKSRYKGAWLYHLLLMQILKQVIDEDNLYLYHFGILRQVLEMVASFLGEGRFGFVLHEIGESDETADKINAFSHKRVYDSVNAKLTADNKETFIRVFNNLIQKYNFKI